MGMSLYDITNEIIDLLDLLADPDAEKEDIDKSLKLMQDQFETKFDGYMKALKNLEADEVVIKEEINRLKDRLESNKKSQENLKTAVMNSMIAIEKPKIKTALFSATVKKTNPSVVIVDEDEIPEEFYTTKTIVERKLNKKLLKTHLTESEEEYAYLEQQNSLLIK